MTSEKIGELAQRLEDRDINLDKLSYSLKNISDRDADDIVNSKSAVTMIMLLGNKKYQNLDKTLQDKLKEFFKYKVQRRFAEYILNVVTNPNVVRKGLAMELAEIINDSEGKQQAKAASEVATDKNVLDSPYALELVRIVSNTPNKNQVYFVKVAARYNTSLKAGKAVALANILSNAKSYSGSQYALEIALNDNFLLNYDNIVELVRIIASSTGHFQALWACVAAHSENIITSGRELEVIKILSCFPEEKMQYLTLLEDKTMFDVLHVDTIIYYLNKLLKEDNEKKLKELYDSMIEEMQFEIEEMSESNRGI